VSAIPTNPDLLAYILVKDVYSYNFVRDSRRIKLLGHENSSLHHLLHPDEDFVVYSIFFLETVQTVLSGADLYYWFAASPTVAAEEGVIFVAPFASFFDLQILGSVVALTVQLFFVYRIRVLSRLNEKPSQWLCIIICLVTLSPKSSKRTFSSFQ
jgi:hypothetical protein